MMQFINSTGNTVKLTDIGKVIPFLGTSTPQYISSDDIKKSQIFQLLCVNNKFSIVSINDERIEKNLLRFQNGKVSHLEDKIEVMVRGHFYSNTGYGKANRNLVYALGRAGVRVGIETSSDSNSSLNQIELERIARFRRHLPNAICIDSVIPCFAEKQQYKYNILNTTIEAASVPMQFVNSCNTYDEVWVASDFCKKVLESCGVKKPIFVIPNAVDGKLYNTQAKPHIFSQNLKPFVFISVMSWTYRKGYDALIKAYLKEFADNDPVTLLIVSPYDGLDDACEKYIKKQIAFQKNCPSIARIGRDIPEFEMPRIYKACNCFVLSSRAEGFGLPYVEAGMCGLPIIATRHSGHTMFLNDHNSFLIDVDRISRLEQGKTGVHYWDGELFPELIDDSVIEQLGKTMRTVLNRTDITQIRSNQLQQDLMAYSLEAVGKKALERLKQIWDFQL